MEAQSQPDNYELLEELRDLFDEFPVFTEAVGLSESAEFWDCSPQAVLLGETITIAELLANPEPPDDEPNIELPAEIGALNQWRSEVASGNRTKYEVDPLARAAIHEANSRDELKWGQRSAARESRLKAADAIIEAVAERAA